MTLDFAQRVEAYITSGGAVTLPLLATGLALWTLLALRAMSLRRGLRGALEPAVSARRGGLVSPGVFHELLTVATALDRSARATPRADRTGTDGAESAESDGVELALRNSRARLRRFSRLIRTLVAMAPLLGLLGTVVGMVETFGSLQSRQLFGQRGGGVAGGISLALISTQMGLLVAIPGLVVSRLLDRRARRLDDEVVRLAQMIDLRVRGGGG